MVNFSLQLLTQFLHLYDGIDFNHTNGQKSETSIHLQLHTNDDWPCIKNNYSQTLFYDRWVASDSTVKEFSLSLTS